MVPTRICITGPSGGRRGRYGRRGRAVPQLQGPAVQPAEVDQDVRALGRRQNELLHRHRAVEQAALGSDLPHRQAAEVEAMIRALHPFRIRNLYIRGSTSKNGHTLPLTSM